MPLMVDGGSRCASGATTVSMKTVRVVLDTAEVEAVLSALKLYNSNGGKDETPKYQERTPCVPLRIDGWADPTEVLHQKKEGKLVDVTPDSTKKFIIDAIEELHKTQGLATTEPPRKWAVRVPGQLTGCVLRPVLADRVVYLPMFQEVYAILGSLKGAIAAGDTELIETKHAPRRSPLYRRMRVARLNADGATQAAFDLQAQLLKRHHLEPGNGVVFSIQPPSNLLI